MLQEKNVQVLNFAPAQFPSKIDALTINWAQWIKYLRP